MALAGGLKRHILLQTKRPFIHNNNWQVLTETDANGLTHRWFVYGDYIDEPLMMAANSFKSECDPNYNWGAPFLLMEHGGHGR